MIISLVDIFTVWIFRLKHCFLLPICRLIRNNRNCRLKGTLMNEAEGVTLATLIPFAAALSCSKKNVPYAQKRPRFDEIDLPFRLSSIVRRFRKRCSYRSNFETKTISLTLTIPFFPLHLMSILPPPS